LGRAQHFAIKTTGDCADATGRIFAIPERRQKPVARRDFLAGASLAGAAALTPGLAKAAAPESEPHPSLVNPKKPMPENTTADEIRTLLKLEPNKTCGFVHETYKSALSIAAGGLPDPFAEKRPLGTALYFMVTPEAPVKLHRIKNDQLYHYYLGDPIEVLMLHPNGSSELVIVGPNIPGGQLVQLFIPGDTFHTARITGNRRWFLGGSTEWPGVVVRDDDVELGDVAELAAKYPEAAADIQKFPVPAEK
jgi:uncharacterized protein